MLNFDTIQMIRRETPFGVISRVKEKDTIEFVIFDGSKAFAMNNSEMVLLPAFQSSPRPHEQFRTSVGTEDRQEWNVLDLFTTVGLCESKSEARRELKAGTLSINGVKTLPSAANVSLDFKGLILGRGKLRWCLVNIL